MKSGCLIKGLIWFGCILLLSIIQVGIRNSGIILGGIPTAILCLCMFGMATGLCKLVNNRNYSETSDEQTVSSPSTDIGDVLTAPTVSTWMYSYQMDNGEWLEGVIGITAKEEQTINEAITNKIPLDSLHELSPIKNRISNHINTYVNKDNFYKEIPIRLHDPNYTLES